MTTVAAVLFMLTSLILAYLSSENAVDSVLKDVPPPPAATVPVIPTGELEIQAETQSEENPTEPSTLIEQFDTSPSEGNIIEQFDTSPSQGNVIEQFDAPAIGRKFHRKTTINQKLSIILQQEDIQKFLKSMKTLYLLRHAKSSWNHVELEDFQRPLAPRGIRATHDVASVISSFKDLPTLAYCSPAIRAKETMNLVAESLAQMHQISLAVEYRAEIYDASAISLLSLIQFTPQTEDHILLVGHNPSLEEFASLLLGTPTDQSFIRIPTAPLWQFVFLFRIGNKLSTVSGSCKPLIPMKWAGRLLKKIKFFLGECSNKN